ncbi:MAG: DUF3007 family protein [Cyanobacteriota bacterium]|nr:DUF3007 family protein [Cyanobacteriota bacterium]
MTRGQALLLGLAVFGLGGLGYAGFRAGGLEGFSPGIAASALLMVLVLIWTSTYLVRVLTGTMTYQEQRRLHRLSANALSDDELMQRFQSLPPDEQERLLAEIASADDAPTA